MLGVANGPSKTLGLAKFYSNFTGLAVSFFYTKVSLSLDFLQGQGFRYPDSFVCFLK